MLMIRLQRVGRKHEPVFRLVLTDSKNGPKSGKYLEVLGSYDPRLDNKIENFNIPKIKLHISNGAKLSNTVFNFLVTKKILEGKKINALPKRTPIKKEEAKVEEKKAVEAPVVDSTPVEAPVQAQYFKKIHLTVQNSF